MSFIFQRLGLLRNSSSTLSVEMVISGASLTKLFSKICEGKSGINFKNNEEKATVNILPKLALMVFKMYLVILAKVFLPSLIPEDKTLKLFWIRTISAAYFAISDSVLT